VPYPVVGGVALAQLWILVAESSRAKIYSAKSRMGPLSEIEDLVHPEGRLHEGDLVSDSPGSDGGTTGQGRHFIDDETSAREQQNIDFATYIAHHLERARNERAFDELVLIAPPAFLGLLRSKLSNTLMDRVSLQIDKNLVRQSTPTIAEHLWNENQRE